MSNNSTVAAPWETLKRTYEGFPLYLRRPVGLNFDALAPKFGVQVALTHTFSFRRFDGSPEPIYNHSLEAFDLSVTRYFDQSGDGQIVLIETFGGKRIYYFYVASSIDPDAMVAELRGQFPGYNLEIQSASDPGWRFIRRYTNEYLNEA